MVNVRPALLQTLFAQLTLGAVLPEQVPRYVLLIPIGDATAIAKVVQLVLPRVVRETRLIETLFHADLANSVGLSQVDHQTERRRQIVHIAVVAAEEEVVVEVPTGHSRANVRQQFDVVKVRAATHETQEDRFQVQFPVVQVELLVGSCREAALKTFENLKENQLN